MKDDQMLLSSQRPYVTCCLTLSVLLVCVEELQARASSQQSLYTVQTGSNRLTDFLCRQGALCTQQYVKHSQLAGGEDNLIQTKREGVSVCVILYYSPLFLLI